MYFLSLNQNNLGTHFFVFIYLRKCLNEWCQITTRNNVLSQYHIQKYKRISSYLYVVNIIVLFFCLIYLHESYNKIEVLPILRINIFMFRNKAKRIKNKAENHRVN